MSDKSEYIKIFKVIRRICYIVVISEIYQIKIRISMHQNWHNIDLSSPNKLLECDCIEI